jgi:peptidoglycan/xylan/chitin deacetylase (PgdA/CDA1 family)
MVCDMVIGNVSRPVVAVLSAICMVGALIITVTRLVRSFARFRRHFIPVLLYHALTDDPTQRHDMTVHRSRFERHMEWLCRHGYTSITCSELAANGHRLPARPVAITFDDGFSSIHRLGLPVMQELALRGTLFVSTDYIGSGKAFPFAYAEADPPLTWSQVHDLTLAGFDVGTHGCTHTAFPSLSDAELEHELTKSRRTLLAATGIDAGILAYPYGHTDARVKRAATAAGCRAAFAVYAQPETADRLEIPRMLIRNQTTMLGFSLRMWGIHPYLKSRRWLRPIRTAIQRWRYAFV